MRKRNHIEQIKDTIFLETVLADIRAQKYLEVTDNPSTLNEHIR